MKAKKLASGNWNAQAYSYTDSDGKRHYESFTAPTKAEALRRANEFMTTKHRLLSRRNMTVNEAVSDFIRVKRGVLSPTTITAYLSMQRNHLSKIGAIRLGSLSSADMQEFISDVNASHSAKYTRNCYSMLHAAVTMYLDAAFRVTLPSVAPCTYKLPTDKDIADLMHIASVRMRKAIALGTQTLRRGEVCALKYGDISHDLNRIYIHADMVRTDSYEWIYKEMPKNVSSIRSIDLPPEVMQLLGDGDPDEYVVGLRPNTVTNTFCLYRDRLGLHGIRFHDLRAYAASVMAALNVPTKYIQEKGGWKSDKTLKQVYERTMPDKRSKITSQVNDYYSVQIFGKMQDEMQDNSPQTQHLQA